MADGLVLLGGVDRWNALFAIRLHFLWIKLSPIPKHAVRYVFIKINVDSFDGPVLHGFTRYCIGKRIVTLFLPSFFLCLVLNSLALMLVIPNALGHDVGQILIEFAYPESNVFFQGDLALSTEELHALLVFAVRVSEIVVRQVLLPELQVVSSRLHERLTLAQIQIEDVIDVSAYRNFVPGVVAVKRVDVSLYHCVMDLLFFV